MKPLHGGDITGYRLQYGLDPLDFSASLNPLGMPPAVIRAAKDAVDTACRYPDPYARALTSALSDKLKINPEYLIFGNGSADLIYRYVQAIHPRKALLPVPSFAEYERALQSAGCKIRYHTMRPENAFDMGEAVLAEITQNVDVLFLCQPNNPTGRLMASELLDKILERCRETGTLLFMDECFVPFVTNPKEVGKLSALSRYPGLFILGSFTKLYGMAGLRLGYGLCGDARLLKKMRLCGQPWAVSALAQDAGVAALSQDGYVRESLALIEREKALLTAELQKLGIIIFGGAANYLFFVAQDTALAGKLAQKGIMIRDCANFRGLGPGYYRIAVRTGAENEQLIKAMRKVLQQGE